MKLRPLLCVAVAAGLCVGAAGFIGAAWATNTYPVVFVHGFAGFGRSEGLGFRYWGGYGDIESALKKSFSDQQFFTAAVGPFSSNWDRAVELFYQIKGGCVDYGAGHSAAAGHLRYGRCFTGFYPQWNSDHPIHIVAHSMGGQTARTLAQLLADNGTPKNRRLFGDAPVSGSWIKSITTLSAPHDGTTLADIMTDSMPFIQSLVAGLAILAGGAHGMNHFIFDFKLDQWGIQRQSAGESFPEYMQRVMGSSLWSGGSNRDLAGYDLSTKGAAELNAWVVDHPDIYYFSYGTQSTWTDGVTGWEYPLPLASPLFSLFAGPAFMGRYGREKNGLPAIDRSWWPNDGMVNTRSMKGPTIRRGITGYSASGSGIRDADKEERPLPGVWNWKGVHKGLDHGDIIGWSLKFDSPSFYRGLIDMLRRL